MFECIFHKMNSKILKQTLVSLEKEERGMLRTFRSHSNTLKSKQKHYIFEKFGHRKSQRAASQEAVQLEVG